MILKISLTDQEILKSNDKELIIKVRSPIWICSVDANILEEYDSTDRTNGGYLSIGPNGGIKYTKYK